MAKSFCISSRSSTGGVSNDRYIPICGYATGDQTEAVVQCVCRNAGTFSKMYVYLSANARTSTTTIYFRKNGANGNQTVTVNASTTGWFSDLSNTDSVSAGDKVDYFWDTTTGTGNISIHNQGITFDATTNTTSYLMCVPSTNGGMVYATNNLTRYFSLNGIMIEASDETLTDYDIPYGGTIKNLSVYIRANARTTTTTFYVRKNASNTSISVSVSAGSTGFFEDTSNTSSCSAGDNYNYSVVYGASAENLTLGTIKCEFESTENKFIVPAMRATAFSFTTASATRYFNCGGMNSDFSSTEAPREMYVGFNFKAEKTKTYLSSNTSTNNATLTLRLNGADTGNTVTITASTSGWFESTSSAVDISSGDRLALKMVSGSGTVGLSFINLGFSGYTETATATPFSWASICI